MFLEATGVYGEGVALYLAAQAKFTVSVVNPARIKGFAQCQLQRLKTDKADAKLIAQYCQAMKPPAWQPAPPHIRELQALVKWHDDITTTLTQMANRRAVSDAVVHASLDQLIANLRRERDQIRQQIQAHIDQHPDLKARADLVSGY